MRRTRHRLLVAFVAAVALVLAGCSTDGETDEPADATATADADATTTDDAADAGDSDEDGDAADDADGDASDDGAGDADGSSDAGEDEDGSSDDESDGDDTGDTAEATVATAASDLGDIVVDGEGRTLYMFLPDQADEPTCTGDCAAVWPVFEGPATAGDGVDGSLLSTATHPSGATQVTYGGWPLYYFASDAAPGDVNGQGVNEVWFVIGPDGEPVR